MEYFEGLQQKNIFQGGCSNKRLRTTAVDGIPACHYIRQTSIVSLCLPLPLSLLVFPVVMVSNASFLIWPKNICLMFTVVCSSLLSIDFHTIKITSCYFGCPSCSHHSTEKPHRHCPQILANLFFHIQRYTAVQQK